MNVAEKITKLRTEKGISVNKLANMSGLSQGFVRQIELGEKKPTVESLSLICEALNITLTDFFKKEPLDNKDYLIKTLNKNISSLTTIQIKALIEVAKAMNN